MQYKICKILLIFSLIFISKSYSQTIPPNPEYFGLIQQRVSSAFIYPQEAQIKGWEGIVKVKFTLAADGRIKAINIAESSGYPLLDAAAISAIKDASPYPFPKNLEQDELEVILPVHYAGTPPISEEAQNAAPLGELASFVDLALKNNQPTKVALEEVTLAKLKTVEAKRGFFPGLKFLGYNTTGEVFKVDYEERESKVQVDQPLLTGGRLMDTLKQSQTNLEITQKNYDRLKFDVMQKTETAYYNLIAAKIRLEGQMELLKDAEEMFETIKKLSGLGMIIPLELTSAQAWLEQVRFQMEGIKQDLLMAELTFQQVLNIKETPQVEMQLPEMKKLNLDLDTCLKIAMKNRPEIYLSKLLVKFNYYGRRVEASKNNAFSVDLTGSYGYYQGHFKTEPWRSSSNWYGGLKVTKPFGASTSNTSYTQDKTQPRFGQTSPTASSTVSAEFNLLDNFKRLSDKKRADIDLDRSLSDFNETKKTITFEVRDAFLNYQKAILQLNTARAEMKFRQNELEVNKIRALVGESSLSTAMSTLVNLSDTFTKYVQALANYHIFLANLKKATGYGLKI